jgi:hypothetical protein
MTSSMRDDKILKVAMVDPVSSGIRGERKAINGISVDFVIESEEDTEASTCQKCVCRFKKNVVA